MRQYRIICADVLAGLAQLPDCSARCCVTSPPYWGLRDYGHAGQIGLEPTPDAYVAKMVEVFREVRRVLADDGTLWLNLGDSYANTGGMTGGTKSMENGKRADRMFTVGYRPLTDGLKQKDLTGIPWMTAFALRADGWYLRSDIIWHKPNPMPESVTDRPTKSHEYLFLLAKSQRYYYDAVAIAEPLVYGDHPRNGTPNFIQQAPGQAAQAGISKARRSGNKERKDATERGCPTTGVDGSIPWEGSTRNKRTVWTVTTQPFSEAHFATFPPALIEPCIKAGSAEGDTVLDPFAGAGTTGLVATRLNRNFVGVELNPDYVAMAERRIENDAPLLNKRTAERQDW